MALRRRSTQPRHVAIFLDNASAYGRGVLDGVAEYVLGHGPWSLFVEIRSSAGVEDRWIQRWTGDGVLGLIRSRSAARTLLRRAIPAVETYGYIEDLGLPRVCSDHRAIGALAAEH